MRTSNRLGEALDRESVRFWVVFAFFVTSLFVLRTASPLSWDEAVYAARGADLNSSDFRWGYFSGSYWSDLRAPGFSVALAGVFRFFGATDAAARILTVLFAVIFVVVIARTLDLLFPRRVGTSATLLLVACPGFLATATLSFADIPAAAVVALAVYVLADAWANHRSTYLFLVPVFAGIATTMRFGAMMLGVAPLVGFGALVFYRGYRLRARREMLSVVLCGLATAAVVYGLLATRILTRSSSPLEAKANRLDVVDKPWSQSFEDLFNILKPGRVGYGFGSAFWGWSFAVAFTVLTLAVFCRLLIGLHWPTLAICFVTAVSPLLLYSLSVRQFVSTYLAPLYAVGAAMLAVGFWVAAGASSRLDVCGRPVAADSNRVGDPDPAAVLPAEGADFTHGGSGDRSTSWATRLALIGRPAVVLGPLVVYLLIGWASVRSVERMHRDLFVWDDVRELSAIADDAIGGTCRLVTVRVPQVAWYSDCSVHHFDGPPESGDASDDELAEFVVRQGNRIGASNSGQHYGLLLLEHLSRQPDIDAVMRIAVTGRSVVVGSASADRRAALVVVMQP